MSRALVISVLMLGFAISVVGCNDGKRGTSIRRQKADKDKVGKDKLAAKIKAAEKAEAASAKIAALMKVSDGECLNVEGISKSLLSDKDRVTVYTRDADVGVIEANEDNPIACYTFTSIEDKVIRGQFALTRLQPVVDRPSRLSDSKVDLLLDVAAQNKCENASFANTRGTFTVECKTQDSLTLVKTDSNGTIAEIRNYQLADKEVVITQYKAVSSNISCNSNATALVYTRHVTAIAFEWLDRVELRTSYAKLIDSNVKPKHPDLTAAISNAAPAIREKVGPEEKRPASTNTLTLKTDIYTLLLNTVKNGKVEFPACKNKISAN